MIDGCWVGWRKLGGSSSLRHPTVSPSCRFLNILEALGKLVAHTKSWGFVVVAVNMQIPGRHPRTAEMRFGNLDVGDWER